MREWLYERPVLTPDDFERLAWPYLRASLLEDEREQAIAREQDALLRRGLYG